MAQMVFGRMCYEYDRDKKRTVMHFATERDSERGNPTACGRRKEGFSLQVYAGFNQSPELRLEAGKRVTNCKPCRRAMGW